MLAKKQNHGSSQNERVSFSMLSNDPFISESIHPFEAQWAWWRRQNEPRKHFLMLK